MILETLSCWAKCHQQAAIDKNSSPAAVDFWLGCCVSLQFSFVNSDSSGDFHIHQTRELGLYNRISREKWKLERQSARAAQVSRRLSLLHLLTNNTIK
jgi:hypothetical protein